MDKLEMKWIPVKERLPEKDGEYLVSFKDHIVIESFATNLLALEGNDPGAYVHLIDEDKEAIISGRLNNSGFYDIEEELDYGEWFGDYVIVLFNDDKCAWMPLPEGYYPDNKED